MCMKDYQMVLTQFILTDTDNPSLWTEESLKEVLRGNVVIGYMLRLLDSNEFALSIYSIDESYLETPNSIISLKTLVGAFKQWLESLIEDRYSILFRNPPIKEWLDTKEYWAKKVASTLSKTYNKPFDECLSMLYYVIMECYNKQTVYIGSLNYLVESANNAVKQEFQYMRNRLTGSHPNAIHLDASPSDFNASLEDSVESFHELIGKADPFYAQQEFLEMKELIMKDLRQVFSLREIDQIFMRPEFLPGSVYRKLLKWRKEHKLEDYK